MNYLVYQILLCLLLAALLGGIIGWLWRAINAHREIDTARSEATGLQADLDRAQGTLAAAKRELATVRDDLGATARALEERGGELCARNGLISELEGKLAEQETGFKEEIATTTVALAAAQSELEGLTERCGDLKLEGKAEANRLQQQLDQARESQTEALVASQGLLEAQAAELGAAQERAAELEAQLADHTARAGEERARLRGQVEEAERASAQAEAQAAGDEDRIRTLTAGVGSRDQKVAELEERLGELDGARARIVDLEGRLAQGFEADGERRTELERVQTASREEEERIHQPERRPAAPALTPKPDSGATAADAFAAAARGERPAQIDDLEKIHGVGPVLEKMLYNLGVFTFRQVAHWTPADIAWIESKLDEFPGRIERDNWQGSAREEHRRKYGEEE